MATRPHLAKYQYQPKERAAAKALGEIKYFTGRPCKSGHVAYRLVSNGVCEDCSKVTQKKSLTKKLASNPNWYKENYAKHSEAIKEKSAKYRKNNPEAVRRSYLKSIQKRKPQKAAAEMARQAAKKNATPKWLTKEDWLRIEAVYVAAHKTTILAGFKCHVDHIVPIKGKDVCGLHVPWNLRVVSQSYNSKKKNNLDEGVFFEPSKTGGVLIHNSALPWNWSSKNEQRV